MANASGLDKRYVLSDDMAEFMGKDVASRKQMTQEIWKYIKKHKLNEGRDIHPDEELATILGSKKLTMFKIPGKISEHIVEDAD